jgi:transcriptional regulator with XRE-family HTH domain
MSALSSDQLSILAGALLRLRGLTLAAVFDATGIRVANLSAWLKGKPQVISATRVTALLYHLGVQGGQLRSDLVHTWSDQGNWAHLRTVFNLLQEPMAPRCLFLDEHPGMSHTRFLQWGESWIRLSLTPGPTEQDNLAAMVSPDRMIVLPVALEGIPTQDPQATASALLSLAEQGGQEIPTGELAHGFMQRLGAPPGQAFVLTSGDTLGWRILEASLRSAMRRGLSPTQLALKIETMRLDEDDLARSGKTKLG